MRLFRKLLWLLPIIALFSIFLYGRKQDVSKSLNETPKVPKQVVSKKSKLEPSKKPVQACDDPCYEPEEDYCYDPCDPCVEDAKNRPYQMGYNICENDLPIAYNAPARIDICEGINAFVTGSYIYWEALSDQLALGYVDLASLTPNEFELIKFSTDYKSGFKVGLGTYFDLDNWGLYAQYSRLHMSNSTTYSPDNNENNFFHTSWTFLGSEANSYQFSLIDGNIVAKWRVDFDKIDLEIDRNFYVGTNLIVRPYVGGSSHWFDQRYSLTFSYGTTPTIRKISLKSDSWAIGPRFGFETKWIFFKGFNLFGNAAISLMFASNDSSGSGTQNVTNYILRKDKQYILRDVEELALGLGWGSYFSNNQWYFNLSAAYEAQRYSNTNYMSRYVQFRNTNNNTDNLASSTNDIKPGDLYLHGLTLSARLDF